ncbi:phosphonate C-P lyase system protein PhnH [Shimia thalassica]|uniref:phosphonate C-P lyase system protein PhnH n=1 Tax=Shimia thalassica TaxID=1715693 RepID=UPI0026E21C75|nr:phosphonate C-P lyase system protein PhnH [Shimia thalassica]MDO6520794.1 phosphonate C-P lyase system protein PhnH [Shimia thalassica]
MNSDILKGGFANVPVESAHAFRDIMNVMAKPGEIREVAGAVPPAPLSIAAGVTLLTLCDPETPVYLAECTDTKDVRDWIAFHIGAPISNKADAMFAVGTWATLAPIEEFAIGTSEYPDRSATLIVACDTLESTGAVLRGPGIKTTTHLSLPETRAFQQNAALFPLGLDFLFTAGNRIAAVPRTTKVETS